MGDGRISMTRSGLSLVVAALLLQAPATHAAQLDKDSCTKLKVEQTQLEQGGTRGSLIRGPEWAKVNLAPEKLELVRRLIEVDEQLLFRCGGRPLVLMPSDPDPAAREVEGKEGAKGPPAKGAKTPEKKAPDTEKKSVVPLEKASAPVVDQPAKETAAPPATTVPQPEVVPAATTPASAPAPAPAKEAAKETPPAVTAIQPAAAAAPAPPVPAPALSKEEQDKKAAAIKAAKAKAKKKADDAYSPLFGSWYNPFTQPSPPAKK
jgi:hypothetical protein